jgi:RecA-family ATPase
VRRFLTLCNEIGYEGECGVVLSAHPSLNGMQSGSGISGSTGWHNSVRARAYLREPKADNGDEVDPDERVLEFKKSNYGPTAETIRLRWQNGLFVPVDPLHWSDKRALAANAEEIFLTILTRFQRSDRNVSHQPTSPNYAPTVFAEEPEAQARRCRKAALKGAMSTLFVANRIHVDTYGRPARPAQRIALGAKP